MVPNPWVGVVLALAAFRLTRLAGWDDLPAVLRLRGWVVGENTRRRGVQLYDAGVWYRRPLLAQLLHCAFCAGFWVSSALYVVWLEAPTVALYGSVPFALSAFVGLLAKNLDP